MRQKLKRPTLTIIFILLIVTACNLMTFANSAEPPGLTVIVNFPPKDLSLSIRFADGYITDAVQLQKEQKAWEAYYRFFYMMTRAEMPSFDSDEPSFAGATLIVESSEKSFECLLPPSAFSRYNNMLSLDFAAEAVTEGNMRLRSLLLIAMRVGLTLLIEGVILYAFGYRKKADWIAFAIVNLFTQGTLNAILSTSGPNLGSYWILGYAFLEPIIFIAEAVAFAFLLKGYRKRRAVLYALTANLASLVIGGLLLAYLPV